MISLDCLVRHSFTNNTIVIIMIIIIAVIRDNDNKHNIVNEVRPTRRECALCDERRTMRKCERNGV